MPCLRNDEVFLGVVAPALRDIIEEDEDVGAVIIGMNETARIDNKRSLPDRGKVMCHFKADDGGGFLG